MRYKRLLVTIGLAVSSLVLAGCTSKQELVNETVSPLNRIDLSQPIPTLEIQIENEEDQQLLDELYRIKDDPLDKDFLEIESQL